MVTLISVIGYIARLLDHQGCGSYCYCSAVMPRRQTSSRVGCARRLMLLLSWAGGIKLHVIHVNHVNSREKSRDSSSDSCLGEGSRVEQRKVYTTENVDVASLLGPPGFLCGPWVQDNVGFITGADAAAWPWSVGLLCEFSSCMGQVTPRT